MNAPTLFDVDAPRARHTDDVACHEAAARTAFMQGKLRGQIVDLLSRYQGLTKNETCQHLDVDPIHWPTVASALSQLKNLGLLEWRDEKRAGQNVWYLKEASVEVAGDRL